MRTITLLALVAGCTPLTPEDLDDVSPDSRHHHPDAGTGSGSGSGIGSGSSTGTGSGSGTWWHAPSGTTWQWQLDGTIDTTVDAQMFDIDMFDTPQPVIDTLHGQGRIVICYISAGTFENWRPDASEFPSAAKGNAVDGWAGEWWLDTRNATVRTIMEARMDTAVSKHCDGIEPGNIDGYENAPGFPLTSATQTDYNTFLAAQAHTRNLSIGLKNDVDQAGALQPYFDWALDEQCSQYDECDTLTPFVTAGEAVFHCEYKKTCPAAIKGFTTILKNMDLDAKRTVCP